MPPPPTWMIEYIQRLLHVTSESRIMVKHCISACREQEVIEKSPQCHTSTLFPPTACLTGSKTHFAVVHQNITSCCSSLTVKLYNALICSLRLCLWMLHSFSHPMLDIFAVLVAHILPYKAPISERISPKHTVSVPGEEQDTRSEALADSSVASLLSDLQLPLVLSPWWPIKKHRQAYSWTLAHKGHLSEPIMEHAHLGNTQDKLRTENKEPDKVHDTVHRSVTHNRKWSEVCGRGANYTTCW